MFPILCGCNRLPARHHRDDYSVGYRAYRRLESYKILVNTSGYRMGLIKGIPKQSKALINAVGKGG